MTNSYHGRTAIVSAGCTEFSRASGRSVLDLAVEACDRALDAAGLPADAVDGIVSYSMYGDSVPAESLAAPLGAGDLTYVMDFNQGGQAASYMVMHAAMAVNARLANNILVFRALNGRSGLRVGRESATDVGTLYRYPLGFTAYPQIMAIWCRAYMTATGATEADLEQVVIAEREWAAKNERAAVRAPMDHETYLRSPYVAAPYRRADCTVEIDGAVAVLVTSLDRARDLRLTPIVVQGSAWGTHGFDLDMGGTLLYDDLARNGMSHLAERLWGSAGLGPKDVDVAELYDCFSGVLLQNLEGLGFCEYGAAGQFIRDGNTRLGGSLPVNTNGGLLCEGYLHGMNSVSEAVWQLQGGCGERQVHNPEVGAVCSGGVTSGSALVLTVGR